MVCSHLSAAAGEDFFGCFSLLPFGRPPIFAQAESSCLECLSARAFPPAAPVRWKYLSTSFGIFVAIDSSINLGLRYVKEFSCVAG
jgi:hypothetical protein